MLKKILCISVLLSSIACLSMGLMQPIQGDVICFGDSITHGAKVDGNSWVYVLQQQKHEGVTFINEGRNGRKTADKKELLPVLKKYPDAAYYLIFLGVNDLKNGNDTMVSNCIKNME